MWFSAISISAIAEIEPAKDAGNNDRFVLKVKC
jgi:hypothetical protein